MFPSGKLVKSEELREKTPLEVIEELEKNNFTGYVSFTVKNNTGIHDFSVALIEGKIAGAFHESFKTKENTMGETALKKAQGYGECTGFYDVINLNVEQVKLAVAVRPESEIKTIEKLVEKTESQNESSEEILKKYGLSSLSDYHG